MKKQAWSHSSLKDFEGCQRRYHEVKVLKNYPFQETTHTIYGKDVHKAIEDFGKDGTPIPAKYAQFKPVVEEILKKPGRKLFEHEMGITKDLQPCGFNDPNRWVRGIADLLIINGHKAHCVDYKTGKSSKYADMKQLELLSLAIFKHFPQVKKVKAGLAFLFADDFVRAEFHADQQKTLWGSWFSDVGQLEQSIQSEVWNAKPNFTCRGWCPVKSCVHNEGE